MDCSTAGSPVPHHLLEFAQVHVHCIVMPSNHLILCRPILLLSSIFPSIRVFPNMSQLFTWGGQSIGASASASVLLNSIQSLFHLRLTGLISLLSKGLLRGFSWMQRSKSPSRIYNVRKARGKWRDSDPFSPSGWLKGLIDTQPALSTCVGGDDDGGKCGVKLRLSYKPVFKEVSPSPSGMEHQVVWHRYFR